MPWLRAASASSAGEIADASAVPSGSEVDMRAASHAGRRPSNVLEQLGDERGRALGAAGLDRPVIHLAPDLLGDRGGDLRGPGLLELHSPAAAVAPEPVMHVELLLEVVAEREVEERPAACDQLHSGRETA